MGNVFDGYSGLLWLDESHVTQVGNGLLARKIVDVLYGAEAEELRGGER